MAEKVTTDAEVEFDPETGFVKEIVEDLGSGDATAAAGEDASLRQVREILIGAQSRRLEQKLQGLSEETRTRIDKIETDIKKQLMDLVEAVRSQGEERKTVVATLRSEVTSRHESFEKTLAELSDKTSGLQSTADDVTQKVEGLAKNLASQSERLRVELVDRASLRSLLVEFADRVDDPMAAAIPSPAGRDPKRDEKSR